MTLSDRVEDVPARTHIPHSNANGRPTSLNALGRPTLRVVPTATHIPNSAQPTVSSDAQSTHIADTIKAVAAHPIVATHPPTIGDAARRIWLSPEEVRHGLVGQLGSATAGLIQVAGLTLCWSVARVFFATKTQTVIFAVVLVVTLTAFAIASHI